MKNSPLAIRLPSDEKQHLSADKEQGQGRVPTTHHKRSIRHMWNDS